MSGASTVDRAQPDGVLHVQGEASRAAFMGGQVIERDTLTALVTTWRGRADLNERTGLERLRALTAGQRQCADELEAAALAVAPHFGAIERPPDGEWGARMSEGAVAPQPTTDERQSDANGQLAADPPPQPASTNEKA
jgi:hypothetical protein